jgi:hypothetical protein
LDVVELIENAFDKNKKLSDDYIELVYNYFFSFIIELINNSIEAEATEFDLNISFDKENKDLIIEVIDD